MNTKICTLCKINKKLEEYSLDKRMACGRTSGCRECLAYKSKMYKRNKHNFIPKPIKQNNNVESYYKKNRDKLLKKQEQYRSDPKNKEKRKKYIRTYQQKQRLNKSYKIKDNISRRIRSAINGKKNHKTIELLGCSIKQLKIHLEKQFKNGMSWDNYGLYGWHIDHIKPCSTFDLTDVEQQKICFNYTNLQPLWAEENLSKGNKNSISIL